MKRHLLVASLLFSAMGFSQLSTQILPYSKSNPINSIVAEKTITPLDIEYEERISVELNERDRAGVIETVNYSLANSGTWTDLPNGDKVWQLRIKAPNAIAVSLFLNQYELPEGAYLHIFNHNRTEYIGAFTDANNKTHKMLPTAYLLGEEVVLEYYEPQDVAGQGFFNIEGVNRYFRVSGDERADPCQVDVNCSEGDNWVDQRDAVVRLSVRRGTYTGWCSGSLINNTNQDCKNYILSAWHCGSTQNNYQPTATDLANYVAYWKHQHPNCGSGWSQTVSLGGVTLKARSNDGGGQTGSDYYLLETEDDIPSNYNAYYAGWDANTDASPNGVSIHHPGGDYKKISTYTSSLVSASYTWAGANAHWRVIWSGTANGHGVTEGGSSGSPIFNPQKRIVGQLTGGSSYCNEVQAGGQNQPDYYGKMSYNWESNVNGDDLKNYLAPGSNAKVLDGARKPCELDIDEAGSYNPDVTIFPNPVSDYLTINMDQYQDVQVLITNEMGQILFNKKMISSVDIFDASNLNAGVYFVTFVKEGKKAVKKFVKTK